MKIDDLLEEIAHIRPRSPHIRPAEKPTPCGFSPNSPLSPPYREKKGSHHRQEEGYAPPSRYQPQPPGSKEIVAKDEERVQAAMAEAEQERAAIMEFDGGLPRPQAQRQARMQAYDYLLEDGEGWYVMVAPYRDLKQARRALDLAYGQDRVRAVEFHKPRTR